jgi:hypothetical protein
VRREGLIEGHRQLLLGDEVPSGVAAVVVDLHRLLGLRLVRDRGPGPAAFSHT